MTTIPPARPFPKTAKTDYELLRRPFPKEQIGTLPRTAKRPALDYVSHAYVTDRLRLAAPGWEMEVLDRFEADGDCWVLLRMTIDGVSREEYGDGNDPKTAIGNALRRCAMRWGVALDLWIGEEAVDSGTPPAVAAASVSESATSDGSGDVPLDVSAYGEGAQPDLSDYTITKLVEVYGSKSRAMLAARAIWPSVNSVNDLNAAQRHTLITNKAP